MSEWVKNFSCSEIRRTEPHQDTNILGTANKLKLAAFQPKVINISGTHQMDEAFQRAKSCSYFCLKVSLAPHFSIQMYLYSLTESQETVWPMIYFVMWSQTPFEYWLPSSSTDRLYLAFFYKLCLLEVNWSSQMSVIELEHCVVSVGKRQELSKVAEFV